MNIKLFAAHLLKVSLLLIGVRLLVAALPILIFTMFRQENFFYHLSYYTYWIANFMYAIALICIMGRIRPTTIFIGLLAIFSPGLSGLFSLFLNLEQLKNDE